MAKWVSSREARKATAKNFPGLAARQRYFTALFLFSFLKQAGLGSLISVTHGGCTTLPVCVGMNTLNTLTAVMCSFQGKAPGGHETEMGRLRGNMVYRELPSQELWESSSSASQGWHGTSVFTWLHYWAVKVAMLLCIQTHIQGQSSFLIFLPWLSIAFWTLLLKLQLHEQGPSQKRILNIYIAQITGQNCHTDEVNSFTVLGYLNAHQLSSEKNRGRVIHIKVIASFNPQSLMETEFL